MQLLSSACVVLVITFDNGFSARIKVDDIRFRVRHDGWLRYTSNSSIADDVLSLCATLCRSSSSAAH